VADRREQGLFAGLRPPAGPVDAVNRGPLALPTKLDRMGRSVKHLAGLPCSGVLELAPHTPGQVLPGAGTTTERGTRDKTLASRAKVTASLLLLLSDIGGGALA